ncbi:hypothetical protein [Zhihengliuella flava]|uniref:Secreted protein n=1 Tax=Zhihengliuella flava TaxID=1285193 RepID=A0A931D5T8_9MICC|nr:hypothetical protein [Zhihengliuella flava]MBG6084250.1 hypothetical protein [Zhihengliuella flava]
MNRHSASWQIPSSTRRAAAHWRPATAVALTALLAGLTGCAASSASSNNSSGSASAPGSEEPAAEATEVTADQPRFATTYDGGVLIVDATTGEVLVDEPVEGFARLNAAGDGRHAMLSAEGAFRALDLGSWEQGHGDHSHYFAGPPAVTDVVVPAEQPGHVLAHLGQTALFDDATGTITLLDATALDADADPVIETLELPDAHHGVAAALADGSILTSLGTEDGRNTAAAYARADADGHREIVAQNEDCPGLHGAAIAAEETVAFGCEDGMLIYQDGAFTKAEAADTYARIGNQAEDAESPIVLGDYKVDPDAEQERPTRVSLVDTRDASIDLVELEASYTFRGLGRTVDGGGLVFGMDGTLRQIDVETGEVTDSLELMGSWEEPEDWQQPMPTLAVDGDLAYVTEPETAQVHVVDLAAWELERSIDLPQTPNEITGRS